MGFAELVFFHGLERLLDEIFGLVVKLGWMTVILVGIVVAKKSIQSDRAAAEKIVLILVTLLGLALVSVVCLLLLPNSLSSGASSVLDLRPLVGVGSLFMWLTIALDVTAISKARGSQTELGVGKIMLMLFLPIAGAAYYLISDKSPRSSKARAQN
jgi:hypothetical protein